MNSHSAGGSPNGRAYCTIGDGAASPIPIGQCSTEAVAERQVVDINRVVGFLVLAFIIFFNIPQPRSAAGVVPSIAGTLREAADSITVFFTSVV